MKHKTQPTHTTHESVPPAVAGGSPQPTTAPGSTGAGHHPPATAGGTDTHDSPTPVAAEPTLADLQAENAALKKQLQEQTAHTSLKDKLKQAGARTPKLLLDAAKEALKFTAAGEIENAVEIIEALKDKFPEQFGTTNHASGSAPAVPSIDAGAGRVTKPTLTREALAKMTPERIAELDWDDVRRVLSTK
jgi:hypothetical protein